jgi:hypothetical protein
VLHRRTEQRFGNDLHHLLAFLALGDQHPHLEQAMDAQRTVDFLQHGR